MMTAKTQQRLMAKMCSKTAMKDTAFEKANTSFLSCHSAPMISKNIWEENSTTTIYSNKAKKTQVQIHATFCDQHFPLTPVAFLKENPAHRELPAG